MSAADDRSAEVLLRDADTALCMEPKSRRPMRRADLRVDDAERSLAADFRAAGVGVAIDDSGTGCASLGYVRRDLVTLVKLDRTLITRIDTDQRQRANAAALLSVIQAFGLDVVGEESRLVPRQSNFVPWDAHTDRASCGVNRWTPLTPVSDQRGKPHLLLPFRQHLLDHRPPGDTPGSHRAARVRPI